MSSSQLVVIGSSAGGIEALAQVVATLPADFPAPIVIAQHLDPRRPSHLAEILERHSMLPIKVIEETTELEDGVIFVVPSNRLAEVVKGDVRLRPAKLGRIAPSVDLLLESAAKTFGAGLTAVILTGTGTDGSAGAWHVKQLGGTVVIEDPATAMFPSMPRSVSPSLVDAQAPLDSIGTVVSDLLAAGSATPEGRDDHDFEHLLDRLRERSGIDFSTYKPATISRRLRGRIIATGQPSVAAYAELVQRDPGEYVRLVSSLLIKVTQFFRDPAVFKHLRERILPDLIKAARRDGRELRIWSAGCSTGEEAYTLAIVLAEALGDDSLAVRLFATDVDSAAIAFARRGIYPPGALKSVPAPLRDRYFMAADHGFEVTKRLRALMVFGEHDLGAGAPFPRIDLIMCRNVLIYFTPPMQRLTLETFAYSLRNGGHLVLGPSETVASLPDAYAEEDSRLRVYRRLSGPPTVPLDRLKLTRMPLDIESTPRAESRPVQRDLQPVADEAPATEGLLLGLRVGIVVVDTHYDIVRINTAARRVLGIHGMAFEKDFIHLAETLPSNALRDAIDAALRGDSTTTTYEVESTEVTHDAPRFIDTYVHPYIGALGVLGGAVIELIDITQIGQERTAHARSQHRLEKAVAVNRRLLRANEELTSVVAELRTSNSAMLQSREQAETGREEVETLNQEFQATNEELETLNEELTASVEELRIANDDLGARTEELRLQALELEQQKRQGEQEHTRLEAILASLGDAVLTVDHEGATMATNVAYDRLFGGRDAQIRPEDVAGVPLPENEWPQHRAARGERFRMEFAVSRPDGTRRWFEAVAQPLAAQDQTWGGVVAIRDVSERTMRLSLERLMASAGHELKTPAAAIHNYVQLVNRQLEAGNAKDAGTYAARALAQTRRLGQLIERLFDVTRIQSGQLELVVEPIDVVAVAREAVETAGVMSNAANIRFSTAHRSIQVRGDAGRLSQVFLNLLMNAIEHAPRSAAIDVSARRTGRHAEVEVRDYGDGIPSDSLKTLFEPYARLGHTHRRTGFGLGLFVAREIVTAHGGEIEVSSQEGDGTAIVVRLPLGRRLPRERVRPLLPRT